MTNKSIMKVLDFAYDKACDGTFSLESASEMAENYMYNGGSVYDKVNSLIKWQVEKGVRTR